MAAGLVLIDTSVWIEAIHPQGREECRIVVGQLMGDGRAATCELVIAEVLKGAATQVALAELRDGMSTLVCLDMRGAGTAAGTLALALRHQGLTIPATDLLIAAVAQTHGAAILHRDRHLSRAAAIIGLEEHAAQ